MLSAKEARVIFETNLKFVIEKDIKDAAERGCSGLYVFDRCHTPEIVSLLEEAGYTVEVSHGSGISIKW